MGHGDARPTEHVEKVPGVGDITIDYPGSKDSSPEELTGFRVPAVKMEYGNSLLYYLLGGTWPNVGGHSNADVSFGIWRYPGRPL